MFVNPLIRTLGNWGSSSSSHTHWETVRNLSYTNEAHSVTGSATTSNSNSRQGWYKVTKVCYWSQSRVVSDSSLHVLTTSSLLMYGCLNIFVLHTYICIYTYTYIYIITYVCVWSSLYPNVRPTLELPQLTPLHFVYPTHSLLSIPKVGQVTRLLIQISIRIIKQLY